MGNCKVQGQNRTGIAKNQIFVPVKNPFLALRKVLQAEETSSLICICLVDVGESVLDSFRIMLETNGKPPAGDIPFPDILERFAASPKLRPGLFLFGKQIQAEFRKPPLPAPPIENCIGFLFNNGRNIHISARMGYHPRLRFTSRWLRKKLQIQGAQELRSEVYEGVRRNDEVEAERSRWTFYEAIPTWFIFCRAKISSDRILSLKASLRFAASRVRAASVFPGQRRQRYRFS